MKQINSTTWVTETDGGRFQLKKLDTKEQSIAYEVYGENKRWMVQEVATGAEAFFRYKSNAIKHINAEQNKAAYEERKAKYEAGLKKFKEQGQAKVFVNVVQLDTEVVDEVGFQDEKAARAWMNEHIFQYNPKNGYAMQLAA
ncbi:hypothetical protein [Streptomyces sp. CoH17]|uniref:hypothetical protein n=1 Tax=Streptomyces sp. CoH17 TaxID=2992806 RepID=UPI0022721346|nr:hypothetical protein [Streptomyces sp. CoH17]